MLEPSMSASCEVRKQARPREDIDDLHGLPACLGLAGMFDPVTTTALDDDHREQCHLAVVPETLRTEPEIHREDS